MEDVVGLAGVCEQGKGTGWVSQEPGRSRDLRTKRRPVVGIPFDQAREGCLSFLGANRGNVRDPCAQQEAHGVRRGKS